MMVIYLYDSMVTAAGFWCCTWPLAVI